MGNNKKLLLLISLCASLLLAPRLLLAGPPVAEGKINTNNDAPDKYDASGWISLAGQPPAPAPLGPASSPVIIDGGGVHWKFTTVTLNAKGGLDALVAKDVSLKLSGGISGDNEHLVDPHMPPFPPNNLLPDIETEVKDVGLGKSHVFSAWAEDTHRDSLGKHKDFYGVGGTVEYVAGGVINTLSTDDAWVAAEHGKRPPAPNQPPGIPPGQPGLTTVPYVQYDAPSRILRISPSQVVGGVTFDDPLWNAPVQGMNLHFNGQDETGSWLFGGGHLSLHTPDVVIETELLELSLQGTDGFGVLNRGSTVDGSEGGSSWMNHLNATLAGRAETGVAGTTFGAPAIWLKSGVDLAQMTHGFTMSTGYFPMQMIMGPSLMEVEAEQHGLPGDYNGDGHVDDLDYHMWSAEFGNQHSAADGNGNGIADAADYVVWRENFGEISALTGAGNLARNAISIPEPSLVALAMIALCLVIPTSRIRSTSKPKVNGSGRTTLRHETIRLLARTFAMSRRS